MKHSTTKSVAPESSAGSGDAPPSGAAPVTVGGDGGDLGPSGHPVGPLPVSRGPKLHEAEVGIDWLRFTWDRQRMGELTERLAEYLGTWEVTRGRWSYAERQQFPYGASIQYSDRERPECCCDLPGEACQRLGEDVLLDLLRDAYAMDFQATRIDLRADFHGEPVGLIDLVMRSAQAGELCRAHKVDPRQPFDAENGKLFGRQINLGVRGKNGSGRYVRVYDKGLETGTETVGRWERWESEFSKKVAAQVGEALIVAADWLRGMKQACFGAVDFRENNGQRAYERRPRVQWWHDLLEGLEPITYRKHKTPATLQSYMTWLRRCVSPGLQKLAEHAGQTVPELLLIIGRDAMSPESAIRYERLAHELCDELLEVRAGPRAA